MIMSTGRGLDRAQVGRRQSVAAIRIDGTFWEHPKNTDGLWVAQRHPGASTFTAPQTFNLHHTPAHIADFLELLATIPEGTVIAMAVSRTIVFPNIDAIASARPMMDDAFKTLGTTLRPHQHPGMSWAYLGRKDASGWTRLAESASTYRGVTLSYGLSPQSSTPIAPSIDRHPPDRQRLHLFDFIGSASDLSPIPIFQSPVESNISNPDAIVCEGITTNTTTRILWNQVPVGANAEITAQVAAVDTSGTTRIPRFQILVNNTPIVNQPIQSGTSRAWRQIRGALFNQAPARVSIELRAMSSDKTPLPDIHWASAVIEADRPR